MKRALLFIAVFSLPVTAWMAGAGSQAEKPPVEKPLQVAEKVWFEQHHDIGKYGSNVGWIEFENFVVVVDTAFPMGAENALKNIKETTKGKPIRYAIVTHYHADHSFGTGLFAAEGAVIIAHENARKDYLERNVKTYEGRAKNEPLFARYKAYAPDQTFTDQLILDDGKRRVEIRFFGHAHTTGCIFTWMPKEKVLFTGDACVNGPFNYMGDADTASWIEVLSKAQALEPGHVVPGHGAAGGKEVLEKQKRYFFELREKVGMLVAAGKSLDEAKKVVDLPWWKEWTGAAQMKADNIAFVFEELSKKPR